ncbi:carboxypeptidase M32 [Brevibacillus sp. SYP-B805]|uniref:carboxypeptidase M32 n=1 Tax=Brevibacillus sp. SYP-B805 TaxID=1578199 RepID=UPI0013E9A5B3|nr:carboxypeptidase M32 [Brevibacillus sp. SYP-B805]NGQ94803.1 carboxypeptidase M32 [Brevibacillus sp. SYP-B805]
MSISTLEQRVTTFREYVKKLVSFNQALAILHWDMRVKAPRKGMEARSQLIGVLSGEQFKLATSAELEEHLQALSEPDTYASLDLVTRRTVDEVKKEFERSKKLPADRFKEFVILTAQAGTVWEEARAKSDFAMFRPYLEKIVKFQLEFIEYWGYKGAKYDTLLDMYEPGMTVAQLDTMFATLREKTVALVEAIAASPNKPDISFLTQPYDEAEQEQFGRYILEKIGYDFQAGRLDRSVHPFCTSFAPGDVRITTRYYPDDLRMALFGSIHEAGHAIYEQNINPDLLGTPLCDGTSMGIHESQSRFWENMIARSLPFWQHFYGEAVKRFPAQLAGVSLEQFYRGINQVTPSFIRVEADELTYNLHIMIRYEIEKGLIEETLEVGDLPTVWNSKMKEYLGIVPPNDQEGVLQDVHWSGGSFGYFPTYSLGNVYAAQFAHTMKKEIDGFEELIAAGDFAPIRGWLKEKIHQYGKVKTPNELLQEITGELTNATYLVDYLENKYKAIYRL